MYTRLMHFSSRALHFAPAEGGSSVARVELVPAFRRPAARAARGAPARRLLRQEARRLKAEGRAGRRRRGCFIRRRRDQYASERLT